MIIALLLVFFLILLVQLVSAILLGYLLHWLMPALSLEISVLISVISITSTFYLCVRFLNAMSDYAEKEQIGDETIVEAEKDIFSISRFPSDYLSSRRRGYAGKSIRKKKPS